MLMRLFRCDICKFNEAPIEKNIRDIYDFDITEIPEGWIRLHESDLCPNCQREVIDATKLDVEKKPKRSK